MKLPPKLKGYQNKRFGAVLFFRKLSIYDLVRSLYQEKISWDRQCKN